MSKEVFDCEYNCIWIGNTEGSFYPYELVNKCRTSETVELYQPKNSTSRYVLSLDVATSSASSSDNAALSIIKFHEKKDGTFSKQLVYLRTYNGYELSELAIEVRKMCIRFPSIEKVIIDANAIGAGVVSLLQNTYVDPETNKEYPAFVADTEILYDGNYLPIIRAYKGTNDSNNSGAVSLKMFLENNSLTLPISSMDFRGIENTGKKDKTVLIEEASIFSDVDALVIELGNIKPIVLANGIRYDTDSKSKHKDRYSSVMMACLYIYELEEENKRNRMNDNSEECLCINLSW